MVGLMGILGVTLLITSFIINPGPGPNPNLHQFIQFGRDHYISIMWGAWMQAVSPPMIIGFALGVVHLAEKNRTLAGSLTFLGGVILLIVSMVEVVFYFSALTGTPATTGIISLEIISSVQRLYSIIAAPFLFLTLSVVILQSSVLPRIMAISGFALGGAFFILGLIQLFYPIQSTVDLLSVVQGLWWLTAGVIVFVNSKRLSSNFHKHSS